jgi:hypothetical protein
MTIDLSKIIKENFMSFTPSIAQNIRTEVEDIIEMVSGVESQTKTAYEIEGQLWWSMLALGQQLLQLFFTMREKQETQLKSYDVDDVNYPYVGQKKRRYVSLFGEVTVKRGCYWLKDKGGHYPLDEALSLPQRSFSDWVQQRLSELTLVMPYGDAVDIWSRWLGWTLSKRSSEQLNTDHGEWVRDYDQVRENAEVPPEACILVISADGKGIPMTRQDSPPPEARRGRGQNKTAKKESTITASYAIAPYPRTSDDIIQALVPDSNSSDTPKKVRPTPVDKQLFGTLQGQEAAFDHLVEQVSRREHSQVRHRVALTDGNRGLKKRVQQHFPHFTLIIDIIHVTEYLWDVANTLLGETHAMRDTWMRDALRCVLDDDLDRLLDHLDYQFLRVSSKKQAIVKKVRRYLRNNRQHMDYQSYLAHGYPIGTGVIEGACRHLVKDRFEQAGMRWSKLGAQVMLDLRATFLNGDWDDFQRFRRHQAHQQRYSSSHPDIIPEDIMMSVAA